MLELHGSIHRNFCERCGKFYGIQAVTESTGIPVCDCGGIIKPDVVLYEEGLNENTIDESVRYISSAEILIIGGTSLAVYPAAGLVTYFRGKRLVVINKTPTPMDSRADLLLSGKIGETLSEVVQV